ncbi:MAG: S9 family peptidase [Marinifilaceae bacterium]|nr:S9 family peptidase [Marinifilaceae bacterium]
MKYSITLIFILFIITISVGQQLEYPICPKQTVADTFFNTYTVTENYRWMEDVRSPVVEKWISEENKLFNKFISKGTSKYRCKMDIDKYSSIHTNYSVKRGKYYFATKIRNEHTTAGLYISDKPDIVDQLLIDPNFNTKNKSVTIEGFSVSKDSKMLCYLTSTNGTDWMEARVISLPSGARKKDHLLGIKHSSAIWKGDGFFYSKYPYENEFSATSGEEVYYHKLGEEQSQDQLIFKRNNPNIQFSFKCSSNERFFLLEEEVAGQYNYFFIDYDAKTSYLRPLLMKQQERLTLLDSNNGKLIIKTYKDNNGGSIVEIDPYQPYQWREIVPEHSDAVLTSCRVKSNCILCIFQSNLQPILKIYNYQGKVIHMERMPIASSINGFDGKKEDEDLVYYNECFTIPKVQYYFNTKNFETKNGEFSNVIFNYKNYEYKLIKYPGKDGVSIPMTLIYKKGIKLDGDAPTILKTYGGFGVISTPQFDPGIVYFIEHGGLYAFANIRGGGDLGSEWAKAGKHLNKQNSIEDFTAAAEFLIKEKYTNPQKLAITGASHGGLIVAAAAIQRPDLYAAVIPVVATTDMLRFEQFTVGNFHTDEFGTVKDSLDFVNLKSYSPLHNIKEDVNYPSMLVMTSENDDRVPPLHSYKFVAELQNRKAQTNPILLRVEKNAGHNGADNLISYIRSKSDMYKFIMKILMN